MSCEFLAKSNHSPMMAHPARREIHAAREIICAPRRKDLGKSSLLVRVSRVDQDHASHGARVCIGEHECVHTSERLSRENIWWRNPKPSEQDMEVPRRIQACGRCGKLAAWTGAPKADFQQPPISEVGATIRNRNLISETRNTDSGTSAQIRPRGAVSGGRCLPYSYAADRSPGNVGSRTNPSCRRLSKASIA
jgi:hypothetical protein